MADEHDDDFENEQQRAEREALDALNKRAKAIQSRVMEDCLFMLETPQGRRMLRFILGEKGAQIYANPAVSIENGTIRHLPPDEAMFNAGRLFTGQQLIRLLQQADPLALAKLEQREGDDNA